LTSAAATFPEGVAEVADEQGRAAESAPPAPAGHSSAAEQPLDAVEELTTEGADDGIPDDGIPVAAHDQEAVAAATADGDTADHPAGAEHPPAGS
jgi:hypothetical protein